VIAIATVPRAPREPLIDALRACAILGVLIANAQSYPTGPYGTPLGLPTPPDSRLAWLVHGGVALLVQGKAYPLLAFLFGYSQVLSQRGVAAASALQRRRRRMGRLLALGVLHGALLYAGDILTLYAVCGLLLLHQALARARAIVRQLRAWLLITLAVYVIEAWFAWTSAPVSGAASPPWSLLYTAAPNVAAYVALNAEVYAGAQLIALLLFLPEVMTLMLAGLLAARLRLLTHRRWRGLVARMARIALPLGLLGNAVYALGVTAGSRHGVAGQWPWLIIGLPLGWLLSAGFCAVVATAWHAGPPPILRALVPLGRVTLSLYVALSLLCALLLSGAGLQWRAGTVALALAAIALWLIALGAAHWAASRGVQGPLEAWMVRR
jgi:uncharacterized protein